MCNSIDETYDVDLLLKQVDQLQKEREELLRQLHTYKDMNLSDIRYQLLLSEISCITRGIIHDLRSGLGIIRNRMGFIEEDLEDDLIRSDIESISLSLDFCDLVLGNLAALGEEDILQPEEIDLRTAIEDVYAILERKLVNVKLSIEIDPKARTIWINESQIKQLFMNLIKNAGEAMPEGGNLTIRAQYDESKSLYLEIQDTGCGIASEYQDWLFQDLFTTKERGYGLGLYVVDRIIKRNGGTIKVESEMGKGTTFRIRLPAVVGGIDG